MTNLQVSVLRDCAVPASGSTLGGLSGNLAGQQGRSRQIEWLLERRLIRTHGGRYLATKRGKAILAHQLS
jgi:hypothetical protein